MRTFTLAGPITLIPLTALCSHVQLLEGLSIRSLQGELLGWSLVLLSGSILQGHGAVTGLALAQCLAGSRVKLSLVISILMADCFHPRLKGVELQSLFNAAETPHPSYLGRIQLASSYLFKLKGGASHSVITAGFGGNGADLSSST